MVAEVETARRFLSAVSRVTLDADGGHALIPRANRIGLDTLTEPEKHAKGVRLIRDVRDRGCRCVCWRAYGAPSNTGWNAEHRLTSMNGGIEPATGAGGNGAM